MEKKGQLVRFILVGITILFLGLLIINYSLKQKSEFIKSQLARDDKFSLDKFNLMETINACLEKETNKAILNLGLEDNNKIKEYLIDNLPSCLDLSFFELKGFFVDLDLLDVKSEINDKVILVELYVPLEIRRENSISTPVEKISYSLKISSLEKINNGYIDSESKVFSTNNKLSLILASGSEVQDKEGMPADSISWRLLDKNFDGKEHNQILTQIVYEGNSVRFSSPVSLSIDYVDVALPDGFYEEKLTIAEYNPATKTWTPLISTVDAGAKTVSAEINELGIYGLYVSCDAEAWDPDVSGHYSSICPLPQTCGCQEVIDFGTLYVGAPYIDVVDRCPDPAEVLRGECDLQCGTFVGSVFLGLYGDYLTGDGGEKCDDQPEKLIQLPSDIDLIQPGDIFSEPGIPGHTGFYAGKGYVENHLGSIMYEAFIPDPNGEDVILHSFPPKLGFSLLSTYLIIRGNPTLKFCRYKQCESSSSCTINLCGTKIIEIARRALGHPYCFRPNEWPIESNPPLNGLCPGHVTNEFCSVSEYESLAGSTGKCPIDCSTYVKWVINNYIKENIQDDYESHSLALHGMPSSLDLGKNYGITVDGDPTIGQYSSSDHYDLHLDNLQAGDLVFFAKSYSGWLMGHVAIYAGSGKIIHAAGSGPAIGVVEYDLNDYISILETSGEGIYVGAKRICPEATSPSASVSTVDTSTFPELFSYSSKKNQNLAEALSNIGTEFRNKGVTISKELLAAILSTLRKEVGGAFLPQEETGDYGMGPGCTYTGSCRGSPYDAFKDGDGLGGLDYKGRGYIQITHRYNYLAHCGEECVADLDSDRNLCKCNNRKYCEVTDENICPMVKAMKPEYAGKIFVSYYLEKNLVEKSNSKDYVDVGYRINGAMSYGYAFNNIAQEYITLFENHPDKTNALLTILNS
ncbi:C40 family peptidase [Candidatus Woesearchaeota archaeon]|nr:C40 family peptidase [Candidatus Woesearchaeota archaeon]